MEWNIYAIETYEKDWLWIWENAEDYKQFEKEFTGEDLNILEIMF